MFDKKIILAAAVSLSMAAGLSGCGSKSSAEAADTKGKGEKISVVCTIFPEYDWVREILGDKAGDAELTYLLDSGVDLHSFQPTADDILKISNCDLFIYVGGESDEWVDDALAETSNKDMKVINLMEVMGDKAKEEELKEGMEGEDEHEHEEGEEHEHEHEEEEVEYDEHVWLSLKNAKILCAEIERDLAAIDPENADTYKANLDAYTAKLDSLDNDIKTLVESAGDTTLIFGDRFPFRYFVDDYGIDYYAAFVGCSAETEASFETLAFLAGKTDELGCDTVYTIENSDEKIAQAIIDTTSSKDQKIASLNSVQSVSKQDIENGTTYLSLMQQNYETLKADIG